MIRFIFYFLFLFFTSIQSFAVDTTSAPFRLHILKEPQNLDPQAQGSSGSYLLQSLHRGLYKYDNKLGLIPDLAEKCTLSKKKTLLTCNLKKNIKWSDGAKIKASDFVDSVQYLLKNPLISGSGLNLLSLKNANQFIESKKDFSEVGVTALNEETLQFEFSEAQYEFTFNLIQTPLCPRPKNEKQFSGPYQLKEWKKGDRIVLTKNLNYIEGNPNRPDVEFLFINEDTTALKLYEKNQLDFLRRLPTSFYKEWKDKKDFKSFEILRFDYYGFNNSKLILEQRKALSESLDYLDLQKIYNSIGRPGCAALPESFFSKNKIPCLDYSIKDPKQNKISWGKNDLVIGFSSQGGDDHRRLAEWLQSQWKSHLGLELKIQAMENKVFLAQIKDNPPAVFRKGVTLDRPTCLAAVETFSKDHSENYLKINSPDYEMILEQLKIETNPRKAKALCSKAVKWLLEQYYLIPAGRFDFFTLLKPQFSGLELNLMNQLFLDNFRRNE